MLSATATCPYCASAIDENNPALVCEKIERDLKDSWHLAESDSTYGWPIGKEIRLPGLGFAAEVVDKKVKVDTSEMESGYYSGGELPQGTTFVTHVVLKVGEHFYKKTGEGDSYSEIVWAGPVKPVTPKTEMRVVYTFG